MCEVYSNYGIIFSQISSFPKMLFGYLKLYSLFEENGRVRKKELFQLVKVTYYILCRDSELTTIY